MSNNKRTAYLAVTLILMFTVVLSACMNAVSSQDEGSKDTTDDVISIGDAPVTQTELKQKFEIYNHDSTEDGKKVLTLFNDVQISALLLEIERSESDASSSRPYLTGEEVLFIIDDTVRMYNEYDKIVLNRWEELPFVKDYVDDMNNINRETETAAESIEVACYHGDFSEYSYGDAVVKYQTMLYDIYDIISYRLALHDSRFMNTYGYGRMHIGVGEDREAFTFNINDFKNGGITLGFNSCRILMTDGGAIESRDEYKKYIDGIFDFLRLDGDSVSIEVEDVKSEHPIFVMRAEDGMTDSVRIEYDGIRLYTSRDSYEAVFPTQELIAKRPAPVLDASCFEAVSEYQLMLHMPSGEIYYDDATGESFTLQPNFEYAVDTIMNNAKLVGTVASAKEPSFDICKYMEDDELYFGVRVGQSTAFYFTLDGNGYIKIVGGRKTVYYSFDYNIGTPHYLYHLFNRFSAALISYSEISSLGAWEGYPNGVDDYTEMWSMGSGFELDREDKFIPSAVNVKLDRGVEEYNGYSYAEFIKEHGYALKSHGELDKYFYYTDSGLSNAVFSFTVDDGFNMQNCQLEGGKYSAYVTVTGKTESGAYIAKGYGAGVNLTYIKVLAVTGYVPPSHHYARELVFTLDEDIPIGTEMVIAFEMDMNADFYYGNTWYVTPKFYKIAKKGTE